MSTSEYLTREGQINKQEKAQMLDHESAYFDRDIASRILELELFLPSGLLSLQVMRASAVVFDAWKLILHVKRNCI